MTYLNLVNGVLRRLREDEVSNVSESTYSKMVGDYVNDGKTHYFLVRNDKSLC